MVWCAMVISLPPASSTTTATKTKTTMTMKMIAMCIHAHTLTVYSFLERMSIHRMGVKLSCELENKWLDTPTSVQQQPASTQVQRPLCTTLTVCVWKWHHPRWKSSRLKLNGALKNPTPPNLIHWNSLTGHKFNDHLLSSKQNYVL